MVVHGARLVEPSLLRLMMMCPAVGLVNHQRRTIEPEHCYIHLFPNGPNYQQQESSTNPHYMILYTYIAVHIVIGLIF